MIAKQKAEVMKELFTIFDFETTGLVLINDSERPLKYISDNAKVTNK